jgi:hypothetical protein
MELYQYAQPDVWDLMLHDIVGNITSFMWKRALWHETCCAKNGIKGACVLHIPHNGFHGQGRASFLKQLEIRLSRVLRPL